MTSMDATRTAENRFGVIGGTTESPDENTGGSNDEIIMLLLRDIQSDIAQLTLKTDSLQSTTDDLKLTVGGLSVKVRNVEDDLLLQQQQIADVIEFVESNVSSVDPQMQQQITEFITAVETNVTSLISKDEELQLLITDLSEKQQNDQSQTDFDISVLESTIQSHHQELTDLSNTVNVHVTSLENKDQEVQLLVSDLSTKEENDYGQISGDLTELETTVEDNYQELRGDVDKIAGSLCNSYGYNYEWIDTEYTWEQARSNCIAKGGDLAFHGFDSMSFREELLCNRLNLCGNGIEEDIHWGLRRIPGTNNWEYVDGTDVSFSSIHWSTIDTQPENEDIGEDCASIWNVEYGDGAFLQSWSRQCTARDYYYSVCEYKC